MQRLYINKPLKDNIFGVYLDSTNTVILYKFCTQAKMINFTAP